MLKSPRVLPLPPAEWGEEEHAAFAVLQSKATSGVGAASNVATTLARHPKLAKAFYTFGRHLLVESSVPDRLRELVTLRVAWHKQCGYEWFHHVRFGLQIGMTEAEIEAVKIGPDVGVWTEADRIVLRATDELIGQSEITDATWAALTTILGEQQIMDLVFTIGQYVMVAWAIAAIGIGIEPGYANAKHPLG